MNFSVFQKCTLGLAGVTALGIGLTILVTPQAFYASYGIALGKNADLLSEIRAPAAGLAVLGGIMLLGLFRVAWRETARVAALTVYLAFPAGRLIGILVDGFPSTGILAALVAELFIAALCLSAFSSGRVRAAQHGDAL